MLNLVDLYMQESTRQINGRGYGSFQIEYLNQLPTTIPYKTYRNQEQLALIISCLCFSTFYFGFTLACISTVQPSTLGIYFGQSASKNQTIGILIGVMPLGAAVGAFFSPLLFKIFTRKQFVLLMNVMAILIAGIIQINNIYVLFICRIIQGLIIGGNMAIIPIYINQLTPKDLLGSFGVATQFYVVFAIVVCYGLGVIFYVTQVDGGIVWRIMFSFTGVTSLIQSILIILDFVPESPVSLLKLGKQKQARQILLRFNHQSVIQQVLQGKVNQIDKKVVKIDQTKVNDGQSNIEGIHNVQVKTSNKAIFLGFQLPFMQQLSGINMVVTEIGLIVSHYDKTLGIYTPLIANIIQLIATGMSIPLLSKIGRRPLLLTGNFGLALCNIIIGGLFLVIFLLDWTPAIDMVIVGILIFMVLYALTIGPLVWLYVPEILPANLVPPATSMNWLGCAFCIIVPNFVINAVGSPYPVFFFYGAISMLFFALNYCMVVQTKGLTKNQAMAKLL